MDLTLTLTATGRLARYLRHRFRMERFSEAREGWLPPRVVHLNAWLLDFWNASWPETLPARDLLRLSLWRDLTRKMPPPEPLAADLPLYGLLDDNYGVMVRHRLDPASGVEPAAPLVQWRREVSRAFRKELFAKGFFHPAELPARVTLALESGAGDLPGKIRLAGFESPAPVENALFEALGRQAALDVEEGRGGVKADPDAVSLPSREQEVLYLMERLVEDGRSLPLHRIGVVVPELDKYSPLLSRCLEEITGEAPAPGSAFYNLTLGNPLLSFPLAQAGLLPMRFALEGELRETLLAILLNPYFGSWRGVRHELAEADRFWRKLAMEKGLDDLLALAARQSPSLGKKMTPGGPTDGMGALRTFCGKNFRAVKTGKVWISSLETLWASLGFPVLSDERDRVAWRHLAGILEEMKRHLAASPMDGFEFFAWLKHLIRETRTGTAAPENAGIQILGLIESRGLEFDRLYVLGMTDRALPQPVRPLPLMDFAERKAVLGGTPESQHDFARRAYDHLLTIASAVTLLRPEQEDSEPLLPSPFWPRRETGKGADIWTRPGPGWLRAAWLRSAFEGLRAQGPKEADPGDGRPAGENLLPPALSAGSLEKALACPFRFFLESILRIEPLEEAQPAVTPLERGLRLHRVLRSFTRQLRRLKIDLTEGRERLLELLLECVDEELKDVAGKPAWSVERRIWFGQEPEEARINGTQAAGEDGKEPPGLLTAWLDAEIENRAAGWKVLCEEADFKNLKGRGWPFEVRGRVDRIDAHETEGLRVWDYKTGSTPSSKDVLDRFSAPQLPLYLMALRGGKIEGTDAPPSARRVSAGYIRLKSAGDVRLWHLGGKDFPWGDCLDRWEHVIAELGALLKKGDFPAEPWPLSTGGIKSVDCSTCGFVTLCERGLTGRWSGDDDEESAQDGDVKDDENRGEADDED